MLLARADEVIEYRRYVCFPAISAASPSAADTAVRRPGGQYLTRFGPLRAAPAQTRDSFVQSL